MIKNRSNLGGIVAFLAAGLMIAQAGVADAADFYGNYGSRGGAQLTTWTLGAGTIAGTNAIPDLSNNALGMATHSTGVVYVHGNQEVRFVSNPAVGSSDANLFSIPSTGSGDRLFSMAKDAAGDFYLMGENGGGTGLFKYTSAGAAVGSIFMPSGDFGSGSGNAAIAAANSAGSNSAFNKSDMQVFNDRVYFTFGEGNASDPTAYSIPIADITSSTYALGNVAVEFSAADITTAGGTTGVVARGIALDSNGDLYVSTSDAELFKKSGGTPSLIYDPATVNALYDVDVFDDGGGEELYVPIGGPTDKVINLTLAGAIAGEDYTNAVGLNTILAFSSEPNGGGAVVPEPSTFVLGLLGLIGFAIAGRRRRRS